MTLIEKEECRRRIQPKIEEYLRKRTRPIRATKGERWREGKRERVKERELEAWRERGR